MSRPAPTDAPPVGSVDVPINPIFPVLDTMRAVGALAVLTTHCAFNAGAYFDYGILGPLLARMDVGVAIFFVLSGFLLSRPWLVRARLALPGPRVRHYFWKRALRILPAYWVTAVIALTLIPDNDGLDARGWVKALTMTDIYFSDALPYGLTQTWSLATEVAFYIVLPALMLVVLGRRRRVRYARVIVVLALLVVVNVLWLLELSGHVPGSPGHVNEWLPAYLTWFSAGIGLAALDVTRDRDGRVHRLARAVASSPGACWVAALGLLLVAGTSVAGPMLLVPATAHEALTKNLLYVAVATLLIVPGVFGAATTRYARFMSHPVARHLGLISYSIFLIHMSVLHLVMWLTGYQLFVGHFFQIWVLTLALSLVAAELLYRLIEKPTMRWRNLRPRRATSVSPAPTATTTR